MEEKRYNIDLHHDTKLIRVMKVLLGMICLAGAVYFFISLPGTRASSASAWIAVLFLLVFSFWLIASGTGFTVRYISLTGDRIILKNRSILPPVILTTRSLRYVEFKPLQIDFCAGEKKMTLRLGTYYPEHSAAVLEAVEKFCTENRIEVRGIETSNSNSESNEA